MQSVVRNYRSLAFDPHFSWVYCHFKGLVAASSVWGHGRHQTASEVTPLPTYYSYRVYIYALPPPLSLIGQNLISPQTGNSVHVVGFFMWFEPMLYKPRYMNTCKPTLRITLPALLQTTAVPERFFQQSPVASDVAAAVDRRWVSFRHCCRLGSLWWWYSYWH